MTYRLFQKIKWRVSKVAQWVKSLAAIPSDLSLIPVTHMVEREK